MARGQIAKDKVFAALQQAFGADYIGVVDKKAYLWVNDGGEKLQIAVALTVPKVQVGTVQNASAGFDFDEDAPTPVVAKTSFEPAEITQEEQDNIQTLFERLGL